MREFFMNIKDNAAQVRPAYATIDDWMMISGMGRRAVYDELGLGNLRAVKRGARTLVDVDHGLAWLRSLPPAKIRAPRLRQAAEPQTNAAA